MKGFFHNIFKAKIKSLNQTNYQAMNVALFAIASFLVVGLTNSYSIPPNEELRASAEEQRVNVSEGRLIFAHVVSLVKLVHFGRPNLSFEKAYNSPEI